SRNARRKRERNVRLSYEQSVRPKRGRNAGRRHRRSAKAKRERNARPKRGHSAKPKQLRNATPRASPSWLRRHHSGTRSNRAARPPTYRNTSTATRTVTMRNRRASACLNWRAPGWRRPPRSKKKGKRRSRRSSSRRRSSGESEPVAEPDPETGGFFGDRVRSRGDDPEVVLVLLVSQIGGYSQRRGDRVGIGSPEAETEGGVGGIVEAVVVLPLALHPSNGDAPAELPAQRGNPSARSDENPLAVECVLGESLGWTGCVQYGVAHCVAAKTRDTHPSGKSVAVAPRQGVGIVRKILLLAGYRIPQVVRGAEALRSREVDGKFEHHAAQLCALGMPSDAKPLRTGESQHGRVGGEHVTDDPPHAVPSGGIDEHDEELPADAAALPGIGDGDREFAGDAVREARVARHADRGFGSLDRRCRDQRHIAAEIDACEFFQHLRCEADAAAEEAVVARFFRKLAREFRLEVDVLGADRANRDRVRDAQGQG